MLAVKMGVLHGSISRVAGGVRRQSHGSTDPSTKLKDWDPIL